MTDHKDISRMLDEESRLAREQGLFPGVVVCTGNVREVEVLEARGYAAVEPEHVPMSTDGVFDLASITKVVATATACGVCRDRGLLDFDAPIANYLPEMPDMHAGIIRVRELAMHTSGYDSRKFNHDQQGEALLHAFISAPSQWAPGTHYEYSCRNFFLLGLIVERVSGQGLSAFCQDAIFGPLGMNVTRFGPLINARERVVSSECPPGIISDAQAKAAGRPVGNAGLFSNALDLARFCRMMLQQGFLDGVRVLEKQTVREIIRSCTPETLPRRGFGWDLRPSSECMHRPENLSVEAYGHSGWTGGSLWIDPLLNLFLVILTNRTHPRVNPSKHDQAYKERARIGALMVHALRPNAS